MKFIAAWFCLLFSGTTLLAAALPLERGALAPRPREMLLASLRFSDAYWDEAVGLLRSPAPEELGAHRVRESSWYALGLLIRNQPGDEARALRIIGQVIDRQFVAPGQRWDGTFQRFPEEALPQTGAVEWKNFDPNWREFIGTTFALILTEFESRLPADLRARMTDSIRRAVEGELVQGRTEAYHTNIALMHGFLWSWAGRRLGRSDWVAGGEAWVQKYYNGYAEHETFEEYNSPTYYGVDLFALALCRRDGATEKIRNLGAKMEAGLWRDIARFYHADLKNICGPYDRSYGMDLRHYVSLVGVWMGLTLEKELTPLPDSNGPMDHAADFFCTPTYVLLGAQIPADVLPALRGFQGERTVTRVITPTRTATAWLGPDLMIGGELTQHTLAAGPKISQLHPATAHWRAPGAEVGWMVLRECPPVDAQAGPNTLAVTTTAGDSVFRLCVPGLETAKLTRDRWVLPGLEVNIDTDAREISVVPGDGFVDLRYPHATRLNLRLRHQP